jgi:hypothetical protein
MTPSECIRPFYSFLFLAGAAAPATPAHRFWRAAADIVAGTIQVPRRRVSRPVPFPADNWIRDDIGLPPLAQNPPMPERRLTPAAPACFPTDERLRDDIGLPPLDNGIGIDS